jgi:hypothetical protein
MNARQNQFSTATWTLVYSLNSMEARQCRRRRRDFFLHVLTATDKYRAALEPAKMRINGDDAIFHARARAFRSRKTRSRGA